MSADTLSWPAIRPHPAFADDPGQGEPRLVQLRLHCESEALLRHYAARLMRDPLDLAAHVERCRMLAQGHSGSLGGALLDLFLVLDTRGAGLRRALCDELADALDEEDLRYFRTHLEEGIDGAGVLPMMPGSLLGRGQAGSRHIVARVRGASAEGMSDPVVSAALHLEHGEFDAARRLLEVAVDKAPENHATVAALRELYRRSKDNDGLLALERKLRERGLTSGDRGHRP